MPTPNESTAHVTGHATVLLVDDVRRATDYYRDALGFQVDHYAANPEHYGYAWRDHCFVHFACFEDARPRPNVEVVPPDMFDVYAWVDDVDALHAEVAGRGADIVQPPVDQAYGLRDFRVRDPHGYILAFGQPKELDD